VDSARRDRITITACVLLAALAVVSVVLISVVDFPPGLGLVPLIFGVGVLWLVRGLMIVANRRRLNLQIRRQAPNN
jgi:Flp pilus assembly protein TadB